jgi:hypothetical protein
MLFDYVLKHPASGSPPDFFGLRMGHRVGSIVVSIPACGKEEEEKGTTTRHLGRRGWKVLLMALEANVPAGYALLEVMATWQDCRTGEYGVEGPLDCAGAYNRTLALDPAETLRFYRAHVVVVVVVVVGLFATGAKSTKAARVGCGDDDNDAGGGGPAVGGGR